MKYYHEKFPIVKDMISVLYEYCCTGGCCHIVTDDGNIYDYNLDFVIEYAQCDENKGRIDSELSIAICKILKTMTFLQRAVLFDSIEFGIPYYNQEDFDSFYPHDEDCLKRVFEEYDWDNKFEWQ
jgi:hypothetical protein